MLPVFDNYFFVLTHNIHKLSFMSQVVYMYYVHMILTISLSSFYFVVIMFHFFKTECHVINFSRTRGYTGTG